MKTILCLHHLREKGEFPSQNYLKNNGHDLEKLLETIARTCFSDAYLGRVPAASTDVEYLRTDAQLREMVGLLSRFGKAARYYNLDVIAGVQCDTDSPDQELRRLELAVLRNLPGGIEGQFAKTGGSVTLLFHVIYTKLIGVLEKFARALCRLFTLGDLGDLAGRQTGLLKDFLFIRDEQLGTIQY